MTFDLNSRVKKFRIKNFVKKLGELLNILLPKNYMGRLTVKWGQVWRVPVTHFATFQDLDLISTFASHCEHNQCTSCFESEIGELFAFIL